MTERPQRPSYLTRQVSTWHARAVGVVVLAIGLLFLGLGLLALYRWSTAVHATSPRPALAIGLAITPMIGLLFTLVGKRLVTGRSPHGDSLLSRAVWTSIGVGFVAMGTGFATWLPWNSDLVIPLLSSALLATGCFGVAARPRRR